MIDKYCRDTLHKELKAGSSPDKALEIAFKRGNRLFLRKRLKHLPYILVMWAIIIMSLVAINYMVDQHVANGTINEVSFNAILTKIFGDG